MRWKEELSENGVIKNHYPKARKGKIDPVRLLELLDGHPDWYLKRFAVEFGVRRQRVFETDYAHTQGKPRICGRTRYKAD
jgi:hypothetical protein